MFPLLGTCWCQQTKSTSQGVPIELPQIRRDTILPVTAKPQLRRRAMATVVAAPIATMSFVQFRVRASWDTNPGPKPVRFSRTLKPPRPSAPPSPAPTAARTAVLDKEQVLPLSQLLTLDRIRAERGKKDEKYMGHERWLPVAPKVKKPRAIYNAASLAYMGDCIYELYARRHFLFPPSSISDYNERVMKVVRCEAQDLLLKKLLNEDYLTEEERDVLRWGKNISGNKTRTTKRAGVAVYNRASSLETLIGYLYLTDVKRLEGLMHQLGFSTGASQLIAEELRMNFKKPPIELQSSDTDRRSYGISAF